MEPLVFVLAGAFAMATPLMLAALGELVAEKSGVLNLSVEGMMAIAAAIAFMTTYNTGSFILGFAAGGVSGTLLSAVFALLVLIFLANQVAAGLAVGILGLGLSALLARAYEGMTIVPMGKIATPFLSELPLVGPILFRQDIMVYLAIASGIVLAWFLFRTKQGLVLRVVGENPQSAHSIGLHPTRVRFMACTLRRLHGRCRRRICFHRPDSSLVAGNDRRPWLDRCGACRLCLLAAYPPHGRSLSVRRRSAP